MENFPKIIPWGTEETVASAVWTLGEGGYQRRYHSALIPSIPSFLANKTDNEHQG